MSYQPELGQLFSGAAFTSIPMPRFVTDGLHRLDALYTRRFEGGEYGPRTSNGGGEPLETPVFVLRAYCWCDGEREGHQDGCPPNFVHKSTGFTCYWYKHAGRGATCDRDITEAEWDTMLAECVASVDALPDPYVVMITGSRDFGSDLREPGSKSRFRDDWRAVPSPQRDAMVAALRGARERANAVGRPLLIRHGGANGADRLAGMLASYSGVPTDVWPALWRTENDVEVDGYDLAMARRMQSVYQADGRYRKVAGPERNQAMVDSRPDEVLAFLAVGATNRGTRHAIGAARRAGIPVTEVEA